MALREGGQQINVVIWKAVDKPRVVATHGSDAPTFDYILSLRMGDSFLVSPV